MKDTVNYDIISRAIKYYENLGYNYINVPWSVSYNAIKITSPEKSKIFCYDKDKSLNLVASGEQSFIQLLLDNNIKKGKYQCVTPCFRDDKIDEYHSHTFMKVELIDIGNENSIIDDAYNFFNTYICKGITIENTKIGQDLFYKGIELGSYGYRTIDNENIQWNYGTGVAEPRFSKVLSTIPKGYHNFPIQKGKIGELTKIIEELDEVIDANKNNNKIMEMVELSDLYGAIESYVTTLGCSIEDLKKMNNFTKRSFENGIRI
jgi:hypothetical protein